MLAVIVAALVGIAYGWSESYDEVRNAELQSWRRTTALVGILAVTLQAVLFIAIWTPLGRHNALVTRYKDERGILKLKIDFVNSGKTPAKCESWSFEGAGPTINPSAFPKSMPKERQSIFYLAPNVPMGVFEDALDPSPEHVALIEKGEWSLYVCGEVNYLDVFKKRHTTKFRLVSNRDDFSAGRFVFCRDGNDAN